jgi:hypothetical protein
LFEIEAFLAAAESVLLAGYVRTEIYGWVEL